MTATVAMAELVLGLLGVLVFVCLYSHYADWWRTEIGWHLSAFPLLVGLLELNGLAFRIFGDFPGRQWVTLGVFALVIGVTWWRAWLVYRTNRPPRTGGGGDMSAPIPAYTYRATFVRALDGDTYELLLDFGKFAGAKPCAVVTIRLDGADTPEHAQAGWAEAREFAASLLANSRLVVRTHKGSFERTVAEVWCDGQSLADLLTAAGHVKPAPSPVPPNEGGG